MTMNRILLSVAVSFDSIDQIFVMRHVSNIIVIRLTIDLLSSWFRKIVDTIVTIEREKSYDS